MFSVTCFRIPPFLLGVFWFTVSTSFKQKAEKTPTVFWRSENLLHPGAVVVADNVLKPGASGPKGETMASWADGWESPKLILGGGLKYFLFSSLAGEMIQFDQYFSNGLKPPTRIPFFLMMPCNFCGGLCRLIGH